MTDAEWWRREAKSLSPDCPTEVMANEVADGYRDAVAALDAQIETD